MAMKILKAKPVLIAVFAAGAALILLLIVNLVGLYGDSEQMWLGSVKEFYCTEGRWPDDTADRERHAQGSIADMLDHDHAMWGLTMEIHPRQ